MHRWQHNNLPNEALDSLTQQLTAQQQTKAALAKKAFPTAIVSEEQTKNSEKNNNYYNG